MDATRFPGWHDLAENVQKRLEENSTITNLGVSESLALFQMYEDVVGRAALEDFINASIPDSQHRPGNLHKRLLSLPWRDVFTTNWDSLLERGSSAPEVRRRYTVVTLETDLSRAPGPRIIKLHGGLPNLGHMIITEEDYRRYPDQHAPGGSGEEVRDKGLKC